MELSSAMESATAMLHLCHAIQVVDGLAETGLLVVVLIGLFQIGGPGILGHDPDVLGELLPEGGLIVS